MKPDLIERITAPREKATISGIITVESCISHHVVGNALWSAWRETFVRETFRRCIELAVPTGPDSWRTFLEGRGLFRADCPIEILGFAPAKDWQWRDRVWAWHEANLETKNSPR